MKQNDLTQSVGTSKLPRPLGRGLGGGDTLEGAVPTKDKQQIQAPSSIHMGEKPNPRPHKMNAFHLREQRRDLRINGTPAEGALWRILKAKQINGLQFRRQYSVENYILDFYCPQLKLAIELDGDYHFNGWQQDVDKQRDDDLWKKYGICVLRFENKIVFENHQTIVQSVLWYQKMLTSSDD
ncbi:MAG: endonuclease domain-containing protein [Paludibacteraceae bacterium]